VRLAVGSRQLEVRSRIARMQREGREFGHARASSRTLLGFEPLLEPAMPTRAEAGGESPVVPCVEHDVLVAENLRAEAEMLASGRPSIRVAVLQGRALTYGAGGTEDAPYVQRARERGVAVFRRSSGGTGVLHDEGDLAWTVVLPRSDPRVGRRFVHAYDRLGAGVADALKDVGIEGTWVEPLGLDAGCCLLGPRGQVLVAGARVLGGAAQHLTSRALLHHGHVPATIDRDELRAIFDLDAPTSERLTALDELAAGVDPSAWALTLAQRLAGSLGRDP
jgi:lipoate-protein ligase A